MGLLAGTMLLGSPQGAGATAFNESGDAGQLPASAQIVGAQIGDVIAGTLATDGDVDLFKVSFASTVALVIQAVTITPGLDLNLHLFDAAGHPLGANDDGGASDIDAFDSQLAPEGSSPLTLVAGSYLVAVCHNNCEATDAMGTIIQDNDGGILDPNGVLGGWDISGIPPDTTGNYQLRFLAIPEPTALTLLGAGLLGLAVRRRASA